MGNPNPTVEQRLSELEREVRQIRRDLDKIDDRTKDKRPPVRRAIEKIQERLDRIDPPPPQETSPVDLPSDKKP